MQFEICRWVRNADLMNADVKKASTGIKSIIASIKIQCDGVHSVSRLVDCAGHRECGGQAGRGQPYGSSTEHAHNCSLRGVRLGCEGTTTGICTASINEKELRMLKLASHNVEKINMGTYTWENPLKEASKVGAVHKALMQAHSKFFPHDGPPGRCQKTYRGRSGFETCNKPLVDQSLCSIFSEVKSSLLRVLDDLHLSKVLASIFELRQVHSTAPAVEMLAHVDEVEYAPTEQVVQHLDEPAARDEELAQQQAEHDWADGVVRMIADPTLSNIDGPGTPDMEQVFLFRFSRTPIEFKNALERGPQLATVRDEMTAAGCACTLPSPHAGAKVFVWPPQYQTVMDAIGQLGMPLFSSNVVILESLMPCLEDLVVAIPRKANVHEKERQSLTVVACMAQASAQTQSSDSSDWGDLECVLEEARTFLCCVRVLKDVVTQSTTEAHGGVNPRRFALDSESASSARRKFRRLDLAVEHTDH